MGTLKDKANKRRKNRNNGTIEPKAVEVAGINTPELVPPESKMHSEHGRYIDAAVKSDEGIKPVVGKAVVQNPIDDAPKSVIGTETASLKPVVGKAVVQNPIGIKNPNLEEAKPKTLSDYLAEQRKNLMKDKTDAAKMQKYYALTDALNALGKMTGTAVGGSIGGNVLDSAPVVEAYQPSRGYIDAYERAKQANDRLRALDDKEFQLAYNKQTRDEERAYQQQVREEERAFRAEMAKIDAEIADARANKNFEREKELLGIKAKMEEDAQQKAWDYQTKRDATLHGYDMEEKKASEKIVKMQMEGGSKDKKDTVPFRFSNRKVVDIPTRYYKEIVSSLLGRDINGVYINEKNVRSFMEDNPELISEYLVDYGVIEEPIVKQKEEAASTEQGEAGTSKTKTVWRPDPNKFYGYGNGYLPSKKKVGKQEQTVTVDEDGIEWE